MPGRAVILANNQIYHVLNRGITSQIIFFNKKSYQRALDIFLYYQNRKISLKYSYLISKSTTERLEILEKLKAEKNFLAEIIAYCFMPNHFHFLLKQTASHGISKFLSNFTNSYTRYFNTKNKRKGPLFQGKFKAIRIEADEQLQHVCRYIHLNPYSSYVVKDFKGLENYPYSSFPEYLGKTDTSFCLKKDILNHFKNKEVYKNFVFNQADYQRRLQSIKKLTLE